MTLFEVSWKLCSFHNPVLSLTLLVLSKRRSSTDPTPAFKMRTTLLAACLLWLLALLILLSHLGDLTPGKS